MMGAHDANSLFVSPEFWRHQPTVAFSELLASEAFQSSNRSSAPLPAGHTLRKNTTEVYRAMFERFVRHLSSRHETVLEPTDAAIESFFDGVLGEVTRETYLRYLRLLERAYDYMVHTKVLPANPVTNWVRTRIAAGSNPTSRKRAAAASPMVSAVDVCRLLDWLYTRGAASLAAGRWRDARDLSIASLSLGSGMRFAELSALSRKQVKHWPHSPEAERFEFEIPGWASVATARAHRTSASAMSAQLIEAWWRFRWSDEGRRLKGELVFPSTMSGKPMTQTTLYRNLKDFSNDALKDGALNESTAWVLQHGAQGLRRAYVLSELASGSQAALLTERLGHWQARSVRRYEEQMRRSKPSRTAMDPDVMAIDFDEPPADESQTYS